MYVKLKAIHLNKLDARKLCTRTELKTLQLSVNRNGSGITHPGGVLPYMGYIGMCRCEGYGFQAVYSRIVYINQRVWV